MGRRLVLPPVAAAMLLVVQVGEGFEVPAWALTSPPHSTDELAVRVDRATRPIVDGAAAPALAPPLISVMVPTCNPAVQIAAPPAATRGASPG